MKILITGGTTFASKFAAEYFVAKNNDVTVVNRGSIYNRKPYMDYIDKNLVIYK